MKVYLIFHGSFEIKEHEYDMITNTVFDENGKGIDIHLFMLFTSEKDAKEAKRNKIVGRILELKEEVQTKINEIAVLASKI